MADDSATRVWLVNVEGTLVPRGGTLDEHLRAWLLAFAAEHDLRLVSELDIEDVLRIVGPDLLRATRVCYANRGNAVWARGQQLHLLAFTPPPLLLPFLREHISETLYPLACEPDIVLHRGMVRVRMLGANPTSGECRSFRDWDDAYEERRTWARAFASSFPKLSAMPQGSHCIDIYPAGCDSSQVLAHIHAPLAVVAHANNPQSCAAILASRALERTDGTLVLASGEPALTWALMDAHRHTRG